jgi:hypothetical protein
MADIISTNAAEIIDLLKSNERATAEVLRGEAGILKADILADYRRTVSTWKHSVSFEALVDTQADGSFDLIVGTDDRIYGYVDQGTRPHIIRPKHAKALAFLSGYRAKTAPGVIGATGGGGFGSRVFAQLVHHPGTKARKFTQTIFDKHKALSLRRIARKLAEAWQGN